MCLFSLVYSNWVVSDYKVSALLAYNEIIPHTLSVAQNRISRTHLYQKINVIQQFPTSLFSNSLFMFNLLATCLHCNKRQKSGDV